MAIFFSEDTNGKGTRQIILIEGKGKNNESRKILEMLEYAAKNNPRKKTWVALAKHFENNLIIG